MSSATNIELLVDDIWISILYTLSIADILTVRLTCTYLSSLTRLRTLWHYKFCREVLEKNVPVPGPILPILSISASDLEWRTRKALYLQRRWSKLGPGTVKNYGAVLKDEFVDQLIVIPGGRHFLTVQKSTVVFWAVYKQPRYEHIPMVERLCEWTLPFDGACHVVQDSSAHGVFAFGASHQSNRPVAILTFTSQKLLQELRYYHDLPGVIVSLHKNLLLLNVPTSDQNDGGIEIFDWCNNDITGSARLPRFAHVFGDFGALLFFDYHIVVVWETCISICRVPDIPSYGCSVLEYAKVYRLYEPVIRPISFTTCRPQRLPDSDTVIYSPSDPESLTIMAQSRPSGNLIQSMLVKAPAGFSLPGDEFPYRLARLSVIDTPVSGAGDSKSLCLGSTGRGIWVRGSEVRLCNPVLVCLPPFGMQHTTMSETDAKQPICAFDSVPVSTTRPGEDINSEEGIRSVDFDEGTGRLFVANKEGGITIVDLA